MLPGQRKTRLACRASSWTSGWKLWTFMVLRIWLIAMFNSSRLAVLQIYRENVDDLWKTSVHSSLCLLKTNKAIIEWKLLYVLYAPTFPGRAGWAVYRRWWKLQQRLNVSSSSPPGWHGGHWTAAENAFYLQTEQSRHSLYKPTKQVFINSSTLDLKPVITDFFGHLEAGKTNYERNITS